MNDRERFKPGQRVHFSVYAFERNIPTRVKSRGYHGTVVCTYALGNYIDVRRDGYSRPSRYYGRFWTRCRIANCRRPHRDVELAITEFGTSQ